jgi:hypothetical protein
MIWVVIWGLACLELEITFLERDFKSKNFARVFCKVLPRGFRSKSLLYMGT